MVYTKASTTPRFKVGVRTWRTQLERILAASQAMASLIPDTVTVTASSLLT